MLFCYYAISRYYGPKRVGHGLFPDRVMSSQQLSFPLPPLLSLSFSPSPHAFPLPHPSPSKVTEAELQHIKASAYPLPYVDIKETL